MSRTSSAMQEKNNFVLMGTLLRGRLGVLHRISFGNYANLVHPWSFLVNKGSSLTCMPKSGKKNKSFPLNFTRNQEDVSMRRRKKRKQVEEGALAG